MALRAADWVCQSVEASEVWKVLLQRVVKYLLSHTTFSKEEIHGSIVCLQIYLLICFSLRFPLLLNYLSKHVSLVSYSLFCSNHVSQCK